MSFRLARNVFESLRNIEAGVQEVRWTPYQKLTVRDLTVDDGASPLARRPVVSPV